MLNLCLMKVIYAASTAFQPLSFFFSRLQFSPLLVLAFLALKNPCLIFHYLSCVYPHWFSFPTFPTSVLHLFLLPFVPSFLPCGTLFPPLFHLSPPSPLPPLPLPPPPSFPPLPLPPPSLLPFPPPPPSLSSLPSPPPPPLSLPSFVPESKSRRTVFFFCWGNVGVGGGGGVLGGVCGGGGGEWGVHQRGGVDYRRIHTRMGGGGSVAHLCPDN